MITLKISFEQFSALEAFPLLDRSIRVPQFDGVELDAFYTFSRSESDSVRSSREDAVGLEGVDLRLCLGRGEIGVEQGDVWEVGGLRFEREEHAHDAVEA